MQSSVASHQSPVTSRQSYGRWLFVALLAWMVPLAAQRGASPRAAVSDKPDTPFKLATFEAAGKVRVGLVLQNRVLDIAGANEALTRSTGLSAVTIPSEMRALIE